jgi:hypothetical protein
MKKLVSLVLVVILVLGATGCYTFKHTVGAGSQTGVEVTQRQWYILWGLVPLSPTDSATLAGDATDYTVTTEMNVVDVIIGIFTGIVSIYPQTITVQK